MRVLFAFAGGNGHLQPLLPLAHATAARGHAVAFTGRPGVLPKAFEAFPAGDDTPDERRPLLRLDRTREEHDFRDGFGGWIARARATSTRTAAQQWHPDVIVCDEADFGSMIAAESLGVPHASVVVLAAGTFGRPEGLATLLNEARATHGLPADPDLAMLDRHLVISPVPPTFRPPTPPTQATHLAMAPASPATQPAHPAVPPTHPATPAVPPSTTPAVSRAPSTTPAAPPPAHPDHPAHPAHPAVQFMRPMPLVPPAPTIPPTVYFTLGTIFNTESGDLFTRFLAGFRELPIQLIVTTGAGIDPAELGPQPANVRVERYVPQATLLPRCSAVVSHAGSGTVVGALAHGLPMVLVPMGADQPANADRCAELGLGVVLDAVDSTTADAAEALRTVLGTRGYAEAAAVLRAEIEAMPDPDEVVNRLEILVRQGR